MVQLSKLIEPLKLDTLDRIPGLAFIEKKYNIKPSIALIAVIVLLILLSPFLNTHSLLTSLICYLIPAYLSFLALESSDKDDDIRYLNYWIIFSLAEISTPFLRLFFNKFFYMIFRITVTILLLHPLSDLSLKCYNGLVRPFLVKHETSIDVGLDNLAKQGKKKIIEGVQEGLKTLQ